MTYDIILFTDLGARFWHAKPLGAYRLATELRSKGYTVKVIDFTGKLIINHKLFKNLLDNLVGDNTIFVGFSSMFFADYETNASKEKGYWERISLNEELPNTYPCGQRTFDIWCKYIKKLQPNTKIVFGGNKAFPEADISNEVDYLVVGLADTTIVDLANHLRHKTPLKYMPSATHNWKIINYDPNGASFDFPGSVTTFEETDHIMPGEVLPIETSRGCMFKCKFCAFPLLGRKKTDPAYHKHVDCLAREFKENWEKYRVHKYMFVDDTFNETVDKLKIVLDAKEQSGVDIEFSSYLRVDLIARYPEQISLLKDLGIKSAFFGVETLHPPTAKIIGKGLDGERVKETFYRLQDAWGNVAMFASLIAGLPEETPESLDAMMTWFNQADNPLDGFNLNPLYISKTVWPSDIVKNPEQYGYTMTKTSVIDVFKWKNNIWDFDQVDKLSKSYMNSAFDSGRLKIAHWDIMGVQNYGYTFDEMKGMSLKDLPSKELKIRNQAQFLNYIKTLFNYENISYDWNSQII